MEEYEDPEEYETVYVETVSGEEDEGRLFSGQVNKSSNGII